MKPETAYAWAELLAEIVKTHPALSPAGCRALYDYTRWTLEPFRVIHDGWQPIETAPKDGTEFLGWFEGSTVQIWWMGQGGQWGNDFWEGREPTHWQPLPESPP